MCILDEIHCHTSGESMIRDIPAMIEDMIVSQLVQECISQGLRHQNKCGGGGGSNHIHVSHQLTKSSGSCCDVGCNYHTNVYNY